MTVEERGTQAIPDLTLSERILGPFTLLAGL